ncbi:MAG: hypothetical protein KDC92_16025 [Bacteroidetes bacterium]|nr:hypothetical protein [Bacteroidota bacterium]
MEGVLIAELDLIGKKDTGSTYFFNTDGMTTGMIGYRTANSVSGRHYHKGLSQTKNPETFLLITGTIKLRCINTQTNQDQTWTVAAPKKVQFSPLIWHEVEALTDISFIELNSLQEHIDDTFYDFKVE